MRQAECWNWKSLRAPLEGTEMYIRGKWTHRNASGGTECTFYLCCHDSTVEQKNIIIKWYLLNKSCIKKLLPEYEHFKKESPSVPQPESKNWVVRKISRVFKILPVFPYTKHLSTWLLNMQIHAKVVVSNKAWGDGTDLVSALLWVSHFKSN